MIPKSYDTYQDIIHLSRPPLPHGRTPMSLHDRAGQFAPFSPLTGHDGALDQAAQRHQQGHEQQKIPLSPEGDFLEELY